MGALRLGKNWAQRLCRANRGVCAPLSHRDVLRCLIHFLMPPPPRRYQTILVFNERLKDSMSLEAVLAMMSLSSEFENMMVR